MYAALRVCSYTHFLQQRVMAHLLARSGCRSLTRCVSAGSSIFASGALLPSPHLMGRRGAAFPRPRRHPRSRRRTRRRLCHRRRLCPSHRPLTDHRFSSRRRSLPYHATAVRHVTARHVAARHHAAPRRARRRTSPRRSWRASARHFAAHLSPTCRRLAAPLVAAPPPAASPLVTSPLLNAPLADTAGHV